MKKISVFLVLIIVVQVAFASTEKYRAIWRENPATEMTIGWVQVDGGNAKLYYDYVDLGTNYKLYRNELEIDRSVDYKFMEHNFVRIKNLEPATVYYFVLVDNNSVSRRFSFKTADDNPNMPLSIIAGGDSRNNQWSRRNANLLVSKLRPDCVLFGGDYTALNTYWEWEEWLDDWQLTTAKDGRMIPIIPARGNHETSNEDVYHIFDVTSKDIFYTVEIGGSLLKTFTLNSEISIAGNQSAWLVKELNNSTQSVYKIAQYHRPIRPHVSSKSEQELMWQQWAFPFFEFGVDLVVECDAHTVKTTYPLEPDPDGDEGFVRNDSLGTVYIGEGCWGAPLRVNDDNKSWTRASAMFNQFKWIFVTKTKMEIRTVKTDNAREIEALTDFTKFYIPQKLQVWQPENGTGDVVTIYPRKK